MRQEDIQALLLWYKQEKRDLPWRHDTQFYHVWISEIMLQQTRVEAVKDYYLNFLKELPTIESLANVSEETLLKLWEGLGYYSRARNLKKCAQAILSSPTPPKTYKELLKFPGIGPYTAGAIASICYQEKVPAIDGNVYRVMMRYLNCKKEITRKTTYDFLFQCLLDSMPEQSGTFNQALMELGATICIPNGEAKCTCCPLAKNCLAHLQNTVSILPIKQKKILRKIEKKTMLMIVHYDEVALIKRPNKGLLAGLYGFPSLEGHKSKQEVLKYLREKQYDVLKIESLESTKHIFSHIEWHMIGYIIFISNKETQPEYIWASNQKRKEIYAIGSAYLKYENELSKVLDKKNKNSI